MQVAQELQGLQIRLLQLSDIATISQSFADIGWNKPESIYKGYLKDQDLGKRLCFIARHEGNFSGYSTLLMDSKYNQFKEHSTPEISDLNVLPKFRNKGIATTLIKECEKKAKELKYKIIGLGVGLTADYMNALNLYLKLGYKFDGNGICYNSKIMTYGESVFVDDDLNLYLKKRL